MAPARVSDGCLFVALKCYRDGSEKFGRTLTLGAIAGDERAWGALETDWLGVLGKVGVNYMHMNEAIARKDEFSRIKKKDRDWLIHALATLLEIHQQSGQISTYTCAVDLKAHKEISQRYALPSPARICVRNIFPKILDWYCGFPDQIIDVMDLYFDQGERFMKHLEQDWKSADMRAQFPLWGLVRMIAPVEMKMTPGVQMADMMAWCRTVAEGGPGEKWYAVAHLTLHIAMRHSGRFDREKLLTYPPFAIM